MQLIRVWDCNPRIPLIHYGPEEGGYYLAAKWGHDFPLSLGNVSETSLEYLLTLGTVYVADAHDPGYWVVVDRPTDLPIFYTEIKDDYEHGLYRVVRPFLPEFYFVPKSTRGHRYMQRLHRRAIPGNQYYMKHGGWVFA